MVLLLGLWMTALVERFVAVAHAHGITPVLLMLPDLGSGTSWDGASAYQPWLAGLRGDPDATSLLVVDMAERIEDARRFRVRPDGGHTSVEGNQQIARALAERIRPHLAYRQDGSHAGAGAGP